jgi:hypothetical protein
MSGNSYDNDVVYTDLPPEEPKAKPAAEKKAAPAKKS